MNSFTLGAKCLGVFTELKTTPYLVIIIITICQKGRFDIGVTECIQAYLVLIGTIRNNVIKKLHYRRCG